MSKWCTPQMFLTCLVWCINMILTLWFHFNSIDFAHRMLHLVLIFAPKWDYSWRWSFCIGNTVVIRRQYPPNISNRRYQFPFQICSYDCLWLFGSHLFSKVTLKKNIKKKQTTCTGSVMLRVGSLKSTGRRSIFSLELVSSIYRFDMPFETNRPTIWIPM